MRTWKTVGIAAAVVASSVTLFGQAAAEGALAHALSAAAGSTAGSVMGRAANRLAPTVGQRVSSAASTHQFSTTKNRPRTATPPAQAGAAARPFGRPLIASIQGGEATDTSCASSGNTTQMERAEKSENRNVKVQNGCSVTTGNGTADHPSVINLTLTK
jgi:Mg-chelatase subunit ChlI